MVAEWMKEQENMSWVGELRRAGQWVNIHTGLRRRKDAQVRGWVGTPREGWLG